MFGSLEKVIDAIALCVGLLLLALLVLFGFIELTPSALVGYLLIAAIAGYLGVMLGRRSRTANRYADLIDAQVREVEARTRTTLRNAGLE